VFVDECQDFTETDFLLLACIPQDPRHLFVAGDETQSMNLGSSYRRPKRLRHREWRRIELRGSYRLPLRVCEALEPLALALQAAHRGLHEEDLDLVMPESRKAAVIGPRPIVIAGDLATLERDLRDVLHAYRPLLQAAGSARVSLAERDDDVKNAIAVAAPWAELEIAEMRKVKGLERTCVVFSDRATFGGDEALPEWIYTGLTRSRAVLLLVLWPDASPAVRAVVGRLRRDRLLFWSSEARDLFDDAQQSRGSDDDPL
jgi:superfamily I DNA and RNA helicase